MIGGSGRDSSPFDSSPYGNASPRAFWQRGGSPARFGSENIWLDRSDSSASMSKRPSIEKLKQASRVKNSSMFAREQKNEYDPTSVPLVERPLAANRPLSQVGGNAFAGRGVEGQRLDNSLQGNSPANFKGHRRGESQSKIPFLNRTHSDTPATTAPLEQSPSPSPSRTAASPTKSSLSSRTGHNTFPRNFDPNTSIWSDEDDTETRIIPSRPLRRQAKSVTFDTKPPEVNEYEMVTPDPSVASVASGSREGSYDDFDDDEYDIDLGGGPNEDEDSFDASLEDTDKTPVVLPEDWRHMSPEVASNTLANTFDDPFGSKEGRSTPSQQWNAYRTASVNSDGDSRPLPPVPPFSQEDGRPASPSTIAERVRAAHARTLPSPPQANGIATADFAIKKESLSLEDRLRLMGLQDSTSPKDADAKEAARLRKHGLGIHVREEEVDEDEEFGFSNEFKAPRISRESILRKVQSRTFEKQGNLDIFSEEHSYGDLDPDVPIPSREPSSNFDEIPDDGHVHIKQEDEEEQIDLYSIPAMYAASQDDIEEYDREGSVIRHDISGGDVPDDASCYSGDATVEGAQSNSATDEEGPPTPKQESAIRTSTPRISGGSNGSDHSNLPELSLLDDGDFQSGLASYLGGSSTPPPPPEKDYIHTAQKTIPKLDMQAVQDFMRRDDSPDAEEEEGPSTPSSVVHRPISPEEIPEIIEPPLVPEPQATIKAPGGRLKARVSATPADLQMMAAQRRKVSGADAPPIPEKSPKRLSMSLEPQEVTAESSSLGVPASPINRRQSFRGIDIGDESFGEDISFGLDKEFDRVIESSKVQLFPLPPSAEFPAIEQPSPDGRLHLEQHFSYVTESSTPANLTPRSKKGYLMRQNTKVVVAKRNFSNESGIGPMSPTLEQRPSSAGTRSAGNSPRKPSHERSKSWTTEPWNGKARRKSIRSLSATKRAAASGPVPPLPGQESAVSAGLDTVVEDQAMTGEGDFEDGVERGRLFVKVVGVKELDLPLPQSKYNVFK
jgi:hypothetical protein